MGVDEALDAQALTAVHLAVGAPAPRFSLRDQHGATCEPIGAHRTLLVFFPFAFSSTCTAELAGLSGEADRFRDAGVTVVAISCDPVYSLRAMAERDELDVALLSDFWPHGRVAREYGCFEESYGGPDRSSWLIDETGVARWSLHRTAGEQRSLEEHLSAL